MSSPLLWNPLQVAAHCHHAALEGLAWLDSSLAFPGAQSLLAAQPEQILAGGPEDWAGFERALHAFQSRHPHGAVIGWVEYDGPFRFGCYPQPAFYDHDTLRWHCPAGLPGWWPPPAAAAPPIPRWTAKLDFVAEQNAAQYGALVETAQEHIRAGDIYQVNLAHRFQAAWPASADPFALYCALRTASPAPQAAYLNLGGGPVVLSSSPEEFLRFDGRHVRTRPIKGTRPRSADPVADRQSAQALAASPKERAELLMITDLMRNDLGQVCTYGSVRVAELFRLESYAQVHHLVSTVEGELRPNCSQAAALHACLPGGSITGAPKSRARAIIAALEPVTRGLYTGTLGYFGPNAKSRFNIAIRTLLIKHGHASFHAGAGIVADSIPVHEWQETLAKAAGILQAATV